MVARLTFQVDANSMRQVSEFVTDFAAQHAIAGQEESRILLVLEELITNLAKYGYPNRSGGSAEIALQLADTRLTIEFADDGDPFDPLKERPPDVDAAAEQRPVGGLGIYLVRALADEAHYCRVGERNVLQLTRLVTRIKY